MNPIRTTAATATAASNHAVPSRSRAAWRSLLEPRSMARGVPRRALRRTGAGSFDERARPSRGAGGYEAGPGATGGTTSAGFQPARTAGAWYVVFEEVEQGAASESGAVLTASSGSRNSPDCGPPARGFRLTRPARPLRGSGTRTQRKQARAPASPGREPPQAAPRHAEAGDQVGVRGGSTCRPETGVGEVERAPEEVYRRRHLRGSPPVLLLDGVVETRRARTGSPARAGRSRARCPRGTESGGTPRRR